MQVHGVIRASDVLNNQVHGFDFVRRHDGEPSVVEIVPADDLMEDRATTSVSESFKECGGKQGREEKDELVREILAAKAKKRGSASLAAALQKKSRTHKVMLLSLHSKMLLALPVATMPPESDELKKLIWAARAGTLRTMRGRSRAAGAMWTTVSPEKRRRRDKEARTLVEVGAVAARPIAPVARRRQSAARRALPVVDDADNHARLRVEVGEGSTCGGESQSLSQPEQGRTNRTEAARVDVSAQVVRVAVAVHRRVENGRVALSHVLRTEEQARVSERPSEQARGRRRTSATRWNDGPKTPVSSASTSEKVLQERSLR